MLSNRLHRNSQKQSTGGQPSSRCRRRCGGQLCRLQAWKGCTARISIRIVRRARVTKALAATCAPRQRPTATGIAQAAVFLGPGARRWNGPFQFGSGPSSGLAVAEENRDGHRDGRGQARAAAAENATLSGWVLRSGQSPYQHHLLLHAKSVVPWRRGSSTQISASRSRASVGRFGGIQHDDSAHRRSRVAALCCHRGLEPVDYRRRAGRFPLTHVPQGSGDPRLPQPCFVRFCRTPKSQADHRACSWSTLSTRTPLAKVELGRREISGDSLKRQVGECAGQNLQFMGGSHLLAEAAFRDQNRSARPGSIPLGGCPGCQSGESWSQPPGLAPCRRSPDSKLSAQPRGGSFHRNEFEAVRGLRKLQLSSKTARSCRSANSSLRFFSGSVRSYGVGAKSSGPAVLRRHADPFAQCAPCCRIVTAWRRCGPPVHQPRELPAGTIFSPFVRLRAAVTPPKRAGSIEEVQRALACSAKAVIEGSEQPAPTAAS